jgi:2-polyprenyl-3-methyl-5-hydroxy-6-metoxy-1,4-benzoquinol methylase
VDPLADSQWSAPGTVAGFAQSAPNAVLMTFAEEELKRSGGGRVLDIGCGAGLATGKAPVIYEAAFRREA